MFTPMVESQWILFIEIFSLTLRLGYTNGNANVLLSMVGSVKERKRTNKMST